MRKSSKGTTKSVGPNRLDIKTPKLKTLAVAISALLLCLLLYTGALFKNREKWTSL
jgi:hypothetical protein